MIDAWYFAGDGRTVGPLRLSELKALLHPMANWEKQMVWRAGFGHWQTAGSVWDILELYETPSSGLTVATPAVASARYRDMRNSTPLRILLGIVVLVAAAATGALGLALLQGAPNMAAPPSTMATPDIESGIAAALDKIRTGCRNGSTPRRS